VSVLYAESTAVLRWLLGASDSDRLDAALTSATAVVTSELTTAEVGRSLQRLVATAALDSGDGERAWASYTATSQHWHVYSVSDRILGRVTQTFPREPVRTLDAIHLATALLHATEIGALVVLSIDQRVRANADALGLAVAP
jgi:predicted nucleic acid-binding protein